MAKVRRNIDSTVQERLREMARELRQVLYGQEGCPEWGTTFAKIESDGMSVGLELARLLMEQSVSEQAQRMPEPAQCVDGDVVQPAGTNRSKIESEAGPVNWKEPRGYLKQGRKAFFPPAESAGNRCG